MVELAPNGAPGNFGSSFAGDTFNTSWYLAQMRPTWTIDFVTCVGTDAISTQMCDFMADGGIGTHHIGRLADRTVGLYMIQLDNGERSFAYWRGQSAARAVMDQATLVTDAIAGADIVYLSGISIAILDDTGRTALLQVLKNARASGVTIAFDPNLRPRLWPNIKAMCDAVMAFASVSDLVFPSHDEEALYFGDADITATQDRYKNAGCTTIIVKNGGGEIGFLADGVFGSYHPVMADTVQDTTAAGDSFNAGFLAADGDTAARIGAASDLAGRVIQGAGALVAGAAQAIA
jgi:2-dehydro-3-deoxygluconokinase